MSKDARQTRQRLLDATLEIIGEKGFSAMTVDEIVERAGVAKGTVYYHFKSKAELVQALIAQQPLTARFSAAALSTSDPARRIQAIMRAELEFIRDNRDFARLLITEMWREDRLWRETLLALREGAVGVIREAIAGGIESGAFDRSIDPDIAASAVFGMGATTALDWLMLSPERDVEKVAEQLGRLAVSALAAR